MKKIALTLIALLTIMAAMAQESDNKERRIPRKPDAQQMTDRMAKDLGLNDKQKAQVLQLNKEYQDVLGGPGMGRGPRGGRGHHHGPRPDGKQGQKAKVKSDQQTDAQTGATEQAPKTGKRPDRPQLTEAQKAEFKKHQAKREEYNKKLQEILTADQQKKWQESHKRRGRGRGPRPE